MTGFIKYSTYNFVDKDPIIDYMRTLIHESGRSLKSIADESNVNQNTISNWLYGKTRRPQAAPFNAVLRSLNYKLSIATIESVEIIVPTPIEPVAVAPRRRRLGAAKYANVHHISAHRKKK